MAGFYEDGEAAVVILEQALQKAQPSTKVVPKGDFGLNEDVSIFILECCGNFFEENFAGPTKVARCGFGKGLQEMTLCSRSKFGIEI